MGRGLIRMGDCLFDSNTIQVMDHIDSLSEGIELGAKLLLDNGYTESRYSAALLRNFEEYGSKFMVSPFIILPHARPEQGVLKSGISIILLQQSFYYRECNEPIRLIVILAAQDSKTHLRYLKTLSEIFMNEQKLKRILSSHTKEQLYMELADC